MKRKNGFTLIELLFTIIIISVLAIVGLRIEKSYTRRAMVSEAHMMLDSIANAEKNYLLEHAQYHQSHAIGSCPDGVPSPGAGVQTSYDSVLGVDARSNKYFTLYTVNTANIGMNSSSYVASTVGAGDANGITVTYTQSPGVALVVTSSGL